MTKTPEQLKGAVRNLAKQKGIHAQEIMQIFMFERILERLSISQYRNCFFKRWIVNICDGGCSATYNNGYGYYCQGDLNG